MNDEEEFNRQEKEEAYNELLTFTAKCKLFKKLAEEVDSSYLLLLNKKELPKPPANQASKYDMSNIIYVSPTIVADLDYWSRSKVEFSFLEMVDIYTNWLTISLTMIFINETRFHKNKKLASHINAVIPSVLRNAKSFERKLSEHLKKFNNVDLTDV